MIVCRLCYIFLILVVKHTLIARVMARVTGCFLFPY